MKLAALAVVILALGIALGLALSGQLDEPAVAAPSCPPSSSTKWCATPTPTPTATATPTPAALHTYITSDTGYHSIATALCDEGDEVSGGGFLLGGNPSTIAKSAPIKEPRDGWEVRWNADLASITGYAVCIDNPPLR